MKLFDGKRITVAGLGTHGGAVGNIRWLHEQGAQLTVTDLKSRGELQESVGELSDLSDITWVLGKHRVEDFQETGMVLRNPAMPRNSKYLQAAREANVPIEMDSSLFFKHSPTRLIIGVTGSKGKTTATHAIAHLMQLVYGKVVTLGVENTAPLPALSTLRDGDLVVFELSSWRLEALDEHGLSPHTAVVTSLYEDHLNTYDSFEDYIETKKAIIRHQGVDDRAVLNYDDPRVREWHSEVKGRVSWFSLENTIPGEGVCVERGTVTVQMGKTSAPLFSLDEMPLEGPHERRNILPAVYLAFCNGVRVESMKMHLGDITQVSHRLENVGTYNGVRYVNDSAATIPDATIAALDTFPLENIVLILGGSDKQLQFGGLAERVRRAKIRAFIFLPGSATDNMRREIDGVFTVPPPMYEVESMAEAVARAAEVAQKRDIVLLSPGATSFGLFQHEFDRGDQFKTAVAQLD